MNMELTNPYTVPASEIRARGLKIQQELRQSDIDGLFIVQRVDLFYFSGTAQNGYMYIPAEGRPILFIKQYLPRAAKESSLADIVKIGSIKEIPGLIVDRYGRLPQKLAY
jgi:Xaa-Pro aminopeptidase